MSYIEKTKRLLRRLVRKWAFSLFKRSAPKCHYCDDLLCKRCLFRCHVCEDEGCFLCEPIKGEYVQNMINTVPPSKE